MPDRLQTPWCFLDHGSFRLADITAATAYGISRCCATGLKRGTRRYLATRLPVHYPVRFFLAPQRYSTSRLATLVRHTFHRTFRDITPAPLTVYCRLVNVRDENLVRGDASCGLFVRRVWRQSFLEDLLYEELPLVHVALHGTPTSQLLKTLDGLPQYVLLDRVAVDEGFGEAGPVESQREVQQREGTAGSLVKTFHGQ